MLTRGTPSAQCERVHPSAGAPFKQIRRGLVKKLAGYNPAARCGIVFFPGIAHREAQGS